MSIRLYTDVHVPEAITEGLREREVDVLTSQADNTRTCTDPQLLDRAGSLQRVLVTQDEDFLVETAVRQRAGISFTGVVFAAQTRTTVGQCIADLELIAKVYEPEDLFNQVEYLPLK